VRLYGTWGLHGSVSRSTPAEEAASRPDACRSITPLCGHSKAPWTLGALAPRAGGRDCRRPAMFGDAAAFRPGCRPFAIDGYCSASIPPTCRESVTGPRMRILHERQNASGRLQQSTHGPSRSVTQDSPLPNSPGRSKTPVRSEFSSMNGLAVTECQTRHGFGAAFGVLLTTARRPSASDHSLACEDFGLVVRLAASACLPPSHRCRRRVPWAAPCSARSPSCAASRSRAIRRPVRALRFWDAASGATDNGTGRS